MLLNKGLLKNKSQVQPENRLIIATINKFLTQLQLQFQNAIGKLLVPARIKVTWVSLVATSLMLAACGDNDWVTAGQNNNNFTNPVGFTCNAGSGGFFCPTKTDWGLANGILNSIESFIISIPEIIGTLAIGIVTWLLQAAQTVRFNYSDNRICAATTGGYLSLEPLTRCADQLFDVMKYAPLMLWFIPFFVLLFKVPLSEVFPGLENEGFAKFFIKLLGVTFLCFILDGVVTAVIDVPFRIFLWILNIDQTTLTQPTLGFSGTVDTNPIVTSLNNLSSLFVVNPNSVNGDLGYIIILAVFDIVTALPLLVIGLYFLIRAFVLIVWFVFGPLAVTSTLMPETAFFFSQWRNRLIMTSVSILPVGIIIKFAMVIQTSINAGNFSSAPFQFLMMEFTMFVLFLIGAIMCVVMLMGEVRHATRALKMSKAIVKGTLRNTGLIGGGNSGGRGGMVGRALSVPGAVARAAMAERHNLEEGTGENQVTISKRNLATKVKNRTIGLTTEQAQQVIQRDATKRSVSRFTNKPSSTVSNHEYQERQARDNAALVASMQSMGRSIEQLFRQQSGNFRNSPSGGDHASFSYSTDFWPVVARQVTSETRGGGEEAKAPRVSSKTSGLADGGVSNPPEYSLVNVPTANLKGRNNPNGSTRRGGSVSSTGGGGGGNSNISPAPKVYTISQTQKLSSATAPGLSPIAHPLDGASPTSNLAPADTSTGSNNIASAPLIIVQSSDGSTTTVAAGGGVTFQPISYKGLVAVSKKGRASTNGSGGTKTNNPRRKSNGNTNATQAQAGRQYSWPEVQGATATATSQPPVRTATPTQSRQRITAIAAANNNQPVAAPAFSWPVVAAANRQQPPNSFPIYQPEIGEWINAVSISGELQSEAASRTR